MRHEAGASGKGSDPARRRSISSSEAVELRAKLDAIANAYRVAEQELEAMRASVKVRFSPVSSYLQHGRTR